MTSRREEKDQKATEDGLKIDQELDVDDEEFNSDVDDEEFNSDEDVNSDEDEFNSMCYGDGYDSGEGYEYNSDEIKSDEDVGDGLVDLFEGLKSSKCGKEEIQDITVYSDQLHGLIKKVGEVKKGQFAVSGQLEGAPLVPINIKGYGTISLPLYEKQIVTPLLEFFKKSPHGLKEKTILDESVRKSWELKENEFSIVNPHWDKYLKNKIIPEIAKGMMLEYNEIEAQLYKLLLYEPGSFFKLHRDSEKENGMFGSLIVQLPSKFTGGELIIRHEGEEKIFAFGNNKDGLEEESTEFSIFFAAFYCDLEHEVKPLVEGYRVSLVYNLISKSGQKLMAPTSDTVAQIETFSQLLDDWKYLSPKKLIYILSHKYTIDGLSLDGLKNGDRNIGQFLKAVSDKTGLCVALGILETQEFGTPKDEFNPVVGSYTGTCSKWLKKLNYPLEEDSHQVKLFVKNLSTLEQVEINPKFKKLPEIKDEEYNSLSIPDDVMMVDFTNEVLTKESFKEILVDEVDYLGFTGNEGMEMRRWYRKSVLVFWPKNHTIEEIWSATGDPPREIAQEINPPSSTDKKKKRGRENNSSEKEIKKSKM